MDNEVNVRLSSMSTKLMYRTSTTGAFSQIKNVRGFPALMGAPEQVETTCVEDTQKTYAPGQSDPGEMTFTFAYTGMADGSNWATLRAIQKSEDGAEFQVIFPDGTGFQWSAKVALSMSEIGDGNSPLEFTCTMFVSDEIKPKSEVQAP